MAQTLIEGKFIKNKTVVLPSVSWSTSVSPFIQLGYKIIICDCDKRNLGINTDHLEKICKKFKPGLLLVVNVLGHSNNFNQILKLKKKYKFEVIEDNCESLGSKLNNKSLGTIGLASSHSFYYGHHISTIEGGMVSTKNDKFYNIALAVRSHGWARDMGSEFKRKLERKYKVNEFTSLFTFYYSGFNIRSSDLNAKLGIAQLKKLDRIAFQRHRNFKYYQKKLSNFWKQESDLNIISSFGYATFVKNRLKVFKHLQKKKIESRPLICGNMGQQPFLEKICFFISKRRFNNQFLRKILGVLYKFFSLLIFFENFHLEDNISPF